MSSLPGHIPSQPLPLQPQLLLEQIVHLAGQGLQVYLLLGRRFLTRAGGGRRLTAAFSNSKDAGPVIW